MFTKNSSPVKSKRSGDITFIAADCQITGSLNVKGNARIEGQVDGNIQASGDLTIGPGAVINANIEAQTVSIAGEVRGDIKTTDVLELASTARLYGDIWTRHLKIEQGAHFVGTSQSLDENDNSSIAENPLDSAPGLVKLRDSKKRVNES